MKKALAVKISEIEQLNSELYMKVQKYINDLDLEIREQKRDLKDKTDQIVRLQENLSSEQAKRRQLEEMTNNKQIPIVRKTVCFKH